MENCKTCNNKQNENLKNIMLNADLIEMLNNPDSRSIVLVELNHMLYNSSVILNQLYEFYKKNNCDIYKELLNDSNSTLTMAEKYMLLLSETFKECNNNMDNNCEYNYETLINDEEVKNYIDEIEKEIKDDLEKDLNIK